MSLLLLLSLSLLFVFVLIKSATKTHRGNINNLAPDHSVFLILSCVYVCIINYTPCPRKLDATFVFIIICSCAEIFS